MAAIQDAFEVQVAPYGSGWQAISVGIARGGRPLGFADRVFVLTHEAISPEQFDRDIDQLIEQLKTLKGTGRQALANIAASSK